MAQDPDLSKQTDPAKDQSGAIAKNYGEDELEDLKGDYHRWHPLLRKRSISEEKN